MNEAPLLQAQPQACHFALPPPHRLLPVPLGRLNGVRVQERPLGIDVLDLLRPELDPVPEIQRANVVLDPLHQPLPGEGPAGPRVLGEPPAHGAGVGHGLAEEAGLVHELLGDAADVDAWGGGGVGREGLRWASTLERNVE